MTNPGAHKPERMSTNKIAIATAATRRYARLGLNTVPPPAQALATVPTRRPSAAATKASATGITILNLDNGVASVGAYHFKRNQDRR